jgi:hypothetical protein
MPVFMFARNDKPTTMRRPAATEKPKNAVKKPAEAPPHAEKRASSAAKMVEPTPAHVAVPPPPPILEELAGHLKEKPAPRPSNIEKGPVARPSFLQNLSKEIMLRTPDTIASPGPPQPGPPQRRIAAEPQPLPAEIEPTIYVPRILGEHIRPERGGAATPPPELVVYAPPENLGGLFVAEEVGMAREEARRLWPLYR